MRKKINQLAKGEIGELKARIRLSETELHASVPCGSSWSGSISLVSENGIPFRGLVYADDERIEFVQDAFDGQQVSLSFVVHAEEEKEEEVWEGRFSFVTNMGEFFLPYCFRISLLSQSAGPLPGDLKELAEWTQSRPEQVFELFESGQFVRFSFLKDESLMALYKALLESPDKRQAQEEFLLACGIRQPAKIRVDTEPIQFIYRDESSEGGLTVRRSGSSYAAVTVEAQAPFLRLPKERWGEADFQEDTLRIPLMVRPDRLHAGKNLGMLLVSTGRASFRIPVTVTPERTLTPQEQQQRRYRRSRLQLSRAIISLYAEKDPPANQDSRVLKYLDACESIRDSGTAGKLARAEFLRQMNRRAEEKEILEEIRAEVQRARTENVTQYLWFLYLEEEREKGSRLSDGFLRLLYRLKEEAAGRVELLPLLIRSDNEWAEYPEKCLLRIRDHYLRGQFDLLLRLEALKLLNENPELLQETDRFMTALLLFGARARSWSREIALRAADLIRKQKSFRLGHERLLMMLYDLHPEKEILTALLTILLRREKPSAHYRGWYEKGIQEDVRLTELYEYYLASLPGAYEGEIPQMVQLYYTYNSPRSRDAQRTLYRYILNRYEPDTQMYRLYEKQIQKYAMDQLLLGTVDESESIFYEKMLIPQVLDSRMAVILSEYVYTMHLSLANHRINRILVLYGELKEAFVYPVKKGEAYIPVFTPRCRLLFLDEKGGRYTQSVFRRSKLMKASRELMETLQRLAPNALPFKLMQCQKALKGELSEWEARNLVQQFTDWEELSESYREKLIFSLVKRRNLGTAENAALLKELRRSPYLDAQAGALLAESLLLQGDDEAAAEMVQRFGYRHFDTGLLLRLMNRMIRSRGYHFEKNIHRGVLSLYRREVWDSLTLTWLCRHFNESTEEMLLLLERAISGEALLYDLPERLLGQMLFTGETARSPWVVEQYLKECQAPKIPNRTLLHAYAVERCERYFCQGESIPSNIFAYLASWASTEKKAVMLPDLCQIALTHYYAEQENLSQEERLLAKTFLYHLYDKGLFFAYQEKLSRFFPLPAELADKTLIEYRGREEEPMRIAWRILPQEAEEEFHLGEMPHVFRGIYVKPVLLFADETLEYRIFGSNDPEKIPRAEGRRISRDGESENRFASLNRIITYAIWEIEGWQEEILEFGKRDELLQEYFPLD